MRRFIIPLLLVAALAGAAYAYALNRHATGPLTGEAVSRLVADRRPIAVILDNYSPDARPQTGLDAASLVFETLAEGGITRFMAVYDEHDAARVGPVRSARLYFNSWADGLGVIFGHDGGNVDALQQLPVLHRIYDIDAGRVSAPYSRSSDRAAPHNEYTSTTALRAYAESHGAATAGAPDAIPHKSDAPASARPAHFTLNIQFSYGDYNVTWRYDPSTNDYARSMGGRPHVEATTGQQLRAKNIIVMWSVESAADDPFTPGAIHMTTTPSGAATLYQDGRVIEGHWSKPSIDSPLQWLDLASHPMQLNTGPTWIEVVPTGNSVTTS